MLGKNHCTYVPFWSCFGPKDFLLLGVKLSFDESWLVLASSNNEFLYQLQIFVTCDLMGPWPEVEFWPDPYRSPGTCFDAAWWEEHDGAWIKPLACLIQNLFAKKKSKKDFWGFWPLAAKPLKLAQIWLHMSGRTAHELSNAFSLVSYLK